jgi:hypothetical protein
MNFWLVKVSSTQKMPKIEIEIEIEIEKDIEEDVQEMRADV